MSKATGSGAGQVCARMAIEELRMVPRGSRLMIEERMRVVTAAVTDSAKSAGHLLRGMVPQAALGQAAMVKTALAERACMTAYVPCSE